MYKYPNHSNGGQHVYLIQTQQQVSGPGAGCLILVVSVYVAHAQNSIYYFMTVVTHATFGLLAVAAFLESSSMLTAN